MLRVTAIAAVVLSLASAACAQTSQATSVVRVRIIDPTGAVIPGATVTATSAETASVTTATADPTGTALLHLPAGTYTASIKSSGFELFIGHFQAPMEPSAWFTVTLKVEANVDPIPIDGTLEPLTVERSALTASIPMIEVEALTLRAKPLHHHHHHNLL